MLADGRIAVTARARRRSTGPQEDRRRRRDPGVALPLRLGRQPARGARRRRPRGVPAGETRARGSSIHRALSRAHERRGDPRARSAPRAHARLGARRRRDAGLRLGRRAPSAVAAIVDGRCAVAGDGRDARAAASRSRSTTTSRVTLIGHGRSACTRPSSTPRSLAQLDGGGLSARFSRRLDGAARVPLDAAHAHAWPRRVRAGVDVISLGIGDPDMPPPAELREVFGARGAARRRPRLPDEPRPRASCARRSPAHYARRFGVVLDPEREVMPLLGAKEGLAHLCLAQLDAGRRRRWSPTRATRSTAAARRSPGPRRSALPLRAEHGFLPDLDGDRGRRRAARQPADLRLPEQPDRRRRRRRRSASGSRASGSSAACRSATTTPTPS